VGEITDIVVGGVDTFSLISKAMDVASLAKTLDKDSDVFKVLGLGLKTEDDVATAAEGMEEAMGDEAFATRGELGSNVEEAQSTALQCASSSFQAFALDTSGLGSALPVARRSFERRTSATIDLGAVSGNLVRQNSLSNRVFVNPCVFKIQASGYYYVR
jgi:hypothetical protein